MGVESYQTKLNLTKPRLMEGCLHQETLDTIMSHPKGVVYKGTGYMKRLMIADELKKIYDGKLNKVLNKLQVILRNNKLAYNNEGMEKYKWTDEDQRRTKKFVEKIKKTLKEQRRFRRLEFINSQVLDIIITGDDYEGIKSVKFDLSRHFAMNDLGVLRYFLDIKIAYSLKQCVLVQMGDPFCDPSLYRTIEFLMGEEELLTLKEPALKNSSYRVQKNKGSLEAESIIRVASTKVANDRFREVLSVIFELSELKSIPSEDPYEEAAQQLLEQEPRSPEYVPDPIELKNHVPAHIPKHPKDLVPAEDEAPIEAYIPEVTSAPTPPLPPSFISPQLRFPRLTRRLRRGYCLLLSDLGVSGESSAAVARQPGPTMARSVDFSFVDTIETRESSEFYSRHHDAQKDCAAVRAEIEARVAVLETQARRHEWQRQTADDLVVQHIMRTQALEAGKMAPKKTTRSTQVPPVTPAPTATTTTVTEAQLQVLIDRGVAAAMAEAEASRVRNGYDSNGSGPRLAQAVRECTYLDFLKLELPCEDYYSGSFSGIAMENFEENDDQQELALMCDRMFPEESDRVEKYIGGLPDTIHDSVKATRPKTMQEAIGFANELMDKRIRDVVENKQKFEGTSGNNQNQPQQNKRQNTRRAYVAGNSDRNIYTGSKPLCFKCDYHHEGPCPPRNDNAQARVYVVRNAGANPNNVVADHHYNVEIADGRIIRLNTIMRDCTLNFLNHPFNIDLLPVELGSFDVLIGMDWLSRYNAVIACAKKLMRIPFGNEILTIHGEGSNERNESRLNIISCSKAQEYMSKGCHVFLANIASTKDEDKSKGKRLEDVPII
uniref:Reverse transcriptase domain-containing protein n=1 Tax=Tanacetum cinerariifolium TaxID=118510 RepID=A0A6L2MQV6_TANCI|nr:reverse transcriptase domain-containing protein [Tanacetum cinerariifolium]